MSESQDILSRANAIEEMALNLADDVEREHYDFALLGLYTLMGQASVLKKELEGRVRKGVGKQT